MHDDGDEIIQVDEISEIQAHTLTLIMRDLFPNINLGVTYEILLRFIIHTTYEPIEEELDIEAIAAAMSKEIKEAADAPKTNYWN
jgi:hypothetical protein